MPIYLVSAMIKNLMHEGKLVPSDIIVRLLLTAMLQSGNDRFLVDGFPRNEENRRAYESVVSSDRRRVCRLPQLFSLSAGELPVRRPV
jgi:adenylate kinase family enzyme